jgi:hypothetical protein
MTIGEERRQRIEHTGAGSRGIASDSVQGQLRHRQRIERMGPRYARRFIAVGAAIATVQMLLWCEEVMSAGEVSSVDRVGRD